MSIRRVLFLLLFVILSFIDIEDRDDDLLYTVFAAEYIIHWQYSHKITFSELSAFAVLML